MNEYENEQIRNGQTASSTNQNAHAGYTNAQGGAEHTVNTGSNMAQDNFGYHYGEGFVMSDMPKNAGAQTSSSQKAGANSNTQNTGAQGSTAYNATHTQSSAYGGSAFSGYNEPTYQGGYNGSYRHTYENEDFRQNYNNRNYGEELRHEFSKKSADKTHSDFANTTGGQFYNNSGSDISGNSADGSGSRFKRKNRPGKAKRTSSPVNLTRRGLALLIVLCVLFSGAAGFGGAMLGNSLTDDNSGSVKKASASASGYTLEDATGSNMTVQEITDAAKPSVVEITTESVTSDSWMQQYVTQGAGSGVIITNDGYIMTNNHVIDGASKIAVTTSDGEEYEAKLIGADSNNDVAVIKINAKDLTPATYGNSDQLAVGDLAVAIGNPLGELGGTVTAGIISALDRQLSIDGKTMSLLQTDSSINPGNSGGGLFNDDGQLIGIVVAKSSGSDVEGLGFAIPINTAADVAQQIMDKGYVSGQPSTGMTYTEGSSQSDGFDSFFGGSQSSSGVYIYSVEGTNAKKAGFKSGDLVFAVDGTQITSFEDLSSIITSHKVGDKVTYTIVRNGQTMDISFKLEEKTAE